MEIDVNIDEINLWLKFQLAKENIEDSMDIFNWELVWICEEYMKWTTVSLTSDNKVVDLTPRKFAHIVAKLAFQAFEKWSDWKSPFKVEVNMPKTALSKFKSENKAELKELERLEKMVKKPITLKDVMDAIDKLPNKIWVINNKNIEESIEQKKQPKIKKNIVQEIKQVNISKTIDSVDGNVQWASRTTIEF